LLLLAQSKELSTTTTTGIEEVRMMQGFLWLVELMAMVKTSVRRRLREV
jgi:hypothetical protein